MKTLFLLFNHQITETQREDARQSLKAGRIIEPPDNIKALWKQIPPRLTKIKDYLGPVENWLSSRSKTGDFVLIQGDFGACYIMANFAFERGLVPIYSTTLREAVEESEEDGAVKLFHRFRHQMFRLYEY